MEKLVLQDYGGYHFIYELAVELTKYYEVSYIYSSSSGGANKDYVSQKNLQVYDVALTGIKKSNFINRKINESRYGIEVSKVINTIKPDFLVSTNTPIDALKYITKTKAKVQIAWVQDLLSHAIAGILKKKLGFLGSLIGKYYYHLEKKAYSRCDKVLTISEGLKTELEKWNLRSKIYEFHNWAPVERIPVLEKKNSFSDSHNLIDKFVILYSGSLGFKHDPNMIIEAAKELNHIDDIEFVIISEGAGAQFLKEKKDSEKISNLRILNFQSMELYPSVLASADINLILLDKDAEGYSVPSKTWSAMCSKRAILTNISLENQAAQILSKFKAGYLLSDGQKLSDAITELYSKDEFRFKLSTNAREYAESNFKIEFVAQKFKGIITI